MKKMHDQIELQKERQKPACCDDSECVWAIDGEPNHSCPEFVEVAVAAQMEDLDNFNKMKVLYRIMDWVMGVDVE